MSRKTNPPSKAAAPAPPALVPVSAPGKKKPGKAIPARKAPVVKSSAGPAKTTVPAPKARAKAKPLAAPEKPVAAPARRQPAKAQTARGPAKAKAAAPYSNDDISLRAYFIAEKRRHAGIHAEPHHDWLEAERQLRQEHGLDGKKKKRVTGQ